MADAELQFASIPPPEAVGSKALEKALDDTCADLKSTGIGTGKVLSNAEMPATGAISIMPDQFSCLKPEVAKRLEEIGAQRVEITRSAEGPRISLTLAREQQIETPYDPIPESGDYAQLVRVNLPSQIALTIKPGKGESVEFTNIENITVDTNVKMGFLPEFSANGVTLRGIRAEVKADGSAEITPSAVYLGKAVDPKTAQYPADAYNKLYSDFLVLGKILG